jgi:hypothetical protein
MTWPHVAALVERRRPPGASDRTLAGRAGLPADFVRRHTTRPDTPTSVVPDTVTKLATVCGCDPWWPLEAMLADLGLPTGPPEHHRGEVVTDPAERELLRVYRSLKPSVRKHLALMANSLIGME